ncbi:MAG TPA: 2-dehydropantoate 2-reductase, partial [Pseudomonadales bacterium]|nr:2-dehydropantoate 2-reductase [Pseudomonadales bacterium]
SGMAPCLIARDPERAAQLQQGIKCDGVIYPVDVVDPNQLSPQSISCLLLCTKAHDSMLALSHVAHALSPQGQIICLQNGIGQQAAIAERWPTLSIYAALCTEGVTRTGTGDIIHAGAGHTDIGQLFGPPHTLPDALFSHSLQVYACDNISPLLWRKLAINGAINGLTVKHDCRNGELLQRVDVYNELKGIVDEIGQVLNANGHCEASHGLLEQVQKVCKSTAMNTSSMLQDFRANRPSERAYVYGTLLDEASKAKIDVPMLEQLNHHLMRRETV